MRKKLSFLSVLVSLCLVLSLFVGSGITAKADSVTVTGTVVDGTTGSILYLDTDSGTMTIKIDSSTDLSGVKVLVEGAEVSAVVYRGDDAYMHASSITSEDSAASSTTTTTPIVQGQVAYGTTESKLILATTAGYMTFTIDSSTTYTGITTLYHLENVVVTYETYAGGYVATNIAAPTISTDETVTGPDGESTTKCTGTITSDSTSSILSFYTDGATMKIKLDDSTELAGAQVIYSGASAIIYVYHGDDAYMHAAKVIVFGTDLDTTTATTVYGTVADGTDDDKVVMTTAAGSFTVYLDASTDLTNVTTLLPDTPIEVLCAKGSDGYYHAVTVTDTSKSTTTTSSSSTTSTSSSTSSSSSSSSSSTSISSVTLTFTGTVNSQSTSTMLYLDTTGGTMQFKINTDCDLSACKVLLDGHNLKVTSYRGDDAYWHATAITSDDGTSNNSSTVDTSSTFTASGTITSDSTEEILTFNSPSNGTMKVKLDASTDISSTGVLIQDETYTFTLAHGSDSYLHVVKAED